MWEEDTGQVDSPGWLPEPCSLQTQSSALRFYINCGTALFHAKLCSVKYLVQCVTLNYCLQPPGSVCPPPSSHRAACAQHRPLLWSQHTLEMARNGKDQITEHPPFLGIFGRENRKLIDIIFWQWCRYMISYLVRKIRLQLSVKLICQVKSQKFEIQPSKL